MAVDKSALKPGLFDAIGEEEEDRLIAWMDKDEESIIKKTDLGVSPHFAYVSYMGGFLMCRFDGTAFSFQVHNDGTEEANALHDRLIAARHPHATAKELDEERRFWESGYDACTTLEEIGERTPSKKDVQSLLLYGEGVNGGTQAQFAYSLMLYELGEVDEHGKYTAKHWENIGKAAPKAKRHSRIVNNGEFMTNDLVTKTLFNTTKRGKPVTPDMYDGKHVVKVSNRKAKSETRVWLQSMEIREEEKALATSYLKPEERIYSDAMHSIAKANPGKYRIYGSDVLKQLGYARPQRPENNDVMNESAHLAYKMRGIDYRTEVVKVGKGKGNFKHYRVQERFAALLNGDLTIEYYSEEEEEAYYADLAAKAAKKSKSADCADLEKTAEEAKARAKAAKAKRLAVRESGGKQPSVGAHKLIADWWVDLRINPSEGKDATDAFPLLKYADDANEVFNIDREYLELPGKSTMNDKRIAREIYRHCTTEIKNNETFTLETLMKVTGIPNDKKGRFNAKKSVEKVLNDWKKKGFIESWRFIEEGGTVTKFEVLGFVGNGPSGVVEIGPAE